MLNAAVAATGGEDLRARVLDYFQSTEFDEALDRLLEHQSGGLDIVLEIADEVLTSVESASLRGAVIRYLESYPEAPGLLLLRGYSEVVSADGDKEVAHEEVRTTVEAAAATPGIDIGDTGRTIAQLGVAAHDRGRDSSPIIAAPLFVESSSRTSVRALLSELPDSLATAPFAWLVQSLRERVGELIPRLESA